MHLVFAANATAGAPAEIVFIPEGRHRLTPKSHPAGVLVHLPPERGDAIAAIFNADLAKRGGIRAWFDFEHRRAMPVSGYPTRFRYERGRGIMAAVDWSRSGREALEGGDVGYFSPEFYVDAQGYPAGLPDRGPAGGLVTEPAFRTMERIAAAESDDGELHGLELLAACLEEESRAAALIAAAAAADDEYTRLYRDSPGAIMPEPTAYERLQACFAAEPGESP